MERPSSTHKISIGRRAILINVLSVSLAMLIICITVFSREFIDERHHQINEVVNKTEALKLGVGHLLELDDRDRLQNLLQEWGPQAKAESVAIFDCHRKPVATFNRENHVELDPVEFDRALQNTDWNRFALFTPIIRNGQTVGFLRASLDTRVMWGELFQYASTLAAVFAVAAVGAIYLSWRLLAVISRSIQALTDVARSVTQRGDYSLRVSDQQVAEFDDFEQAMNKMLDRVENADQALQSAHAELEHEVVERTAQLTSEIQERAVVLQELATAKESADAANKAKSEFLANMSHEMRTPLNGILGFTQLLQKDTDASDAEKADYIATIHSSGQHLLELINDILDLSKIEAGHMELEQVTCSSRRLVAEVVSLLRVRAQEKGLALDYEFLGKVPETYTSDPARVKQLLMNLVSNAIKFTSEGSVRIVVSLDSNQECSLVRFDVVDTGIGIPQEKLESIFDPFVQADSSVTRRFGGTGLGLAISRRIARMLGGDLTVCSTVGMGSVFSATVAAGDLSAASFIDTVAGDIDAKPEQLREQPTSISGSKILVVDDGSTNRKLISVILRRAGADVSSAENGRQAVELARRGDFDLVFMDMQMPVLDGYSATRELRAVGYAIPIIALTANAMKGDEQKCLAAGCSGYLTKPIDAKKLIETTVQWLAKSATKSHVDAPAQVMSVEQKPAESPASSPTVSTTSPPQRTEQEIVPLPCELPLDDPEFLEIVHEFTDRLGNRLEELQTALANRDQKSIASLAHWLKGAAGTVGFFDFTAPARDLEKSAQIHDFAASDLHFQAIQALAARIVLPELNAK